MRHFAYSLSFGALICLIFLSCSDKKTETNDTSKTVVEHKAPAAVPSLVNNPIENKSPGDSTANHTDVKFKFKYDLSSPENTSILVSELMEISALSYNSAENVLYAVNDEKGTLYTLEAESGKIQKRLKFGKKGDYEGVEIANGTIYAVKSNGNLHEISGQNGDAEKIKTPLRTKNDVEGLGFDSDRNMLLLACKESPYIGSALGKSKSQKAVYGWSLKKRSMSEEAVLEIEDDQLISFFESLSISASKSKKKKLKKRLKSFSPSGIAYNPHDKMYYMISSVGKTSCSHRSHIGHSTHRISK